MHRTAVSAASSALQVLPPPTHTHILSRSRAPCSACAATVAPDGLTPSAPSVACACPPTPPPLPPPTRLQLPRQGHWNRKHGVIRREQGPPHLEAERLPPALPLPHLLSARGAGALGQAVERHAADLRARAHDRRRPQVYRQQGRPRRVRAVRRRCAALPREACGPNLLCRYLLNSSVGQLASARALELRQAIMFKKDIAAAAGEQGAGPEPVQPAAPARVAPSLAARARPEARVAAAQAAELAGLRRVAAKLAAGVVNPK
jgi:hypothetical protein